jgi:predicted DNA-binding transcriptional regulator YafY
MSKSRRLIDVMMAINTKREFTARELAEEFGVSVRTIQRDLRTLEDIGVPLYAEMGAKGGYRLLNQKILPPITFTENEAVALFFAYQSLQNYQSLPFEHDAKSALNKFYHYLPTETRQKIDEMQNRVLFWTPKRTGEVPYLKHIVDASVEQRVVDIQYDSMERKRIRSIQPIGVYSHNGYWYSPAFCFTRKDYRLFRIDRITFVKDTDLQVNENVKEMHLLKWFDPPIPNDTILLQVKLTRDGVRKCQLEPWLEKKIVVHSGGTGLIKASLSKREIRYYADFFLGVGTDAEVLEPDEMVKVIKEKLRELQSMYDRK